jgi:putative flippase GtrA
LPPQVQDLNVGIIALLVNFSVLIIVSLAMRFATSPAQATAEQVTEVTNQFEEARKKLGNT